ncbi:amine sulfotransferase-like [Pelobates cultripes]|uniref:Sulfotransferase n=1 Tax=Pelobates cultripes TaxID=61616 RepID=A0AAD1VT51_PELCU|nr:amine sulfotransferase-like [Pelobates cultripes]
MVAQPCPVGAHSPPPDLSPVCHCANRVVPGKASQTPQAVLAVQAIVLRSRAAVHCRGACRKPRGEQAACRTGQTRGPGGAAGPGSGSDNRLEIGVSSLLRLLFGEGGPDGSGVLEAVVCVSWPSSSPVRALEKGHYSARKTSYTDKCSSLLRLTLCRLYGVLIPRIICRAAGKIIYVYRNPKDILVSYYHFYRMMVNLQNPDSWEHFIDLFISGKVMLGSWFDHVRGWYTNKEDFDILFMTFEEMKKDLRSAIMKICSFVNKKLDDEALATIVEKSTFRNMRHDPLANYKFIAEDLLDQSKGNFLRKGVIGDWKNFMTVAQSEMFDRVFEDKMKDLPIKFTWDTEESN